MWLVRICVGRDPETRKREYIGKYIHVGLCNAHPPEPLQKPAEIVRSKRLILHRRSRLLFAVPELGDFGLPKG
jgi:hypothetical protein